MKKFIVGIFIIIVLTILIQISVIGGSIKYISDHGLKHAIERVWNGPEK